MKYIKNLILVFIIAVCWTGTARANFFVTNYDQYGAQLSGWQSYAMATYAGNNCAVDFVWEVPGVNTFPQFQYWGSVPIWPQEGVAGCLNVRTSACGGRYTFDRITSGTWMFDVQYTNFMAKTFVPNSASVGNPYLIGYSRACAPGVPIQPGESDVYGAYNRNARVATNKFVWNGSTYVEIEPATTSWYKVGSAAYYVPPNRENNNHFMVGAYHRNYANTITQAQSEIIANGGPYGYVRDELNPATSPTPDEYLDYYYYSGVRFNLTTDLPAPITLPSARHGHTSTLLSNGKVLVLGGENVTNALLDLTTDTWDTSVSTPNFNIYHAATLLNNGQVLVTGGYIGGATVNNAKLYNPATNVWSDAAPMKTARRVHTSTLLPNGKVLVAGGGNSVELNSAELYDPVTNSWTDAAPMAFEHFCRTARCWS